MVEARQRCDQTIRKRLSSKGGPHKEVRLIINEGKAGSLHEQLVDGSPWVHS